MNPIQFEELFDKAGIDRGIESLLGRIRSVNEELAKMMENIKSQAAAAGEALSSSTSSSKGGRDNTAKEAANINQLYAAYMQLGEAYKYVEWNIGSMEKSQQKMEKAIKLGKIAANEQEGSIARLKAQVELAKMAYDSMDKQTRENTNDGKQLAQVIRTLDGQIKAYNASMRASASTTKSVSTTTISLSSSYSTLNNLVSTTGVDLTTLITTEKQQEQATKNGVIANNSLSGSYNQLYAQYNLIKLALNSMSEEMRNNAKVGKVWEAEALRIMETMKVMQESTGKHTLSVGDYGKALNGLNISTQQVMRELPVLANSLQMFFIAISNNVPIFVDNFKRAQEVLGGFGKALGVTLKSIFSWQTALLGVLTIIPMVISNINKKKKAQEADNAEVKKAITLEQALEEARDATAQNIASETTELNFLTRAMNDNNRSWDERIKAAEIMKKKWQDEFDSFTAEEMLAGKAKVAIDELTESLVTQAKARGLLSEIEKLAVQEYEQGKKRDEAMKLQDDTLKAYQSAQSAYDRLMEEGEKARGEGTNAYLEWEEANIQKVVYWKRRVEETRNAFDAMTSVVSIANNEIGKTEESIEELQNRIKVSGLGLDLDEGNLPKPPKDAAEDILEIPNYYLEYLQSVVNLTEDTLEQQLAQLDLDFEKQSQERQSQMDELGKIEVELQKRIADEKNEVKKAEYVEQLRIVREQMRLLNRVIKNEEDAYFKEREEKEIEIALTNLDNMRKDVADKQALLKDARDKEAYESYQAGMDALDQTQDNTQREYELKEELNKKLLDSERKYWEDYLAQLQTEGLITTQEYNRIMEIIAGYNTSKPSSSSTTSRRKRGSKSYRNLTEFFFASSNTFGETDENGLRKIKDDYMDFAVAVNEALETSMDYMDEWMDKRIEMAEVAIEAAEEETEAAKSLLDYEMEARANGYANNVELARKEYEEKKAIEEKAIEEKKRLQRIQEGIDTAEQISSLLTATANIFKGYSKLPFIGQALAVAAVTAMFGSFVAAKIQAAKVTSYGEGMSEYLDYGGSHASGHDIDFGTKKDGTHRRVEKGEVIGVINKRNVRKYGVNKVMGIINDLNKGTYSDKPDFSKLFGMVGYGYPLLGESGSTGLINAFTGANYGNAFKMDSAKTDLSAIESGIGSLVEQGETRVVQTSYGRIEYRGRNKRIIRNG